MAASSNNALIGALRVEATLDAGKFVTGAAKIRKESKQTEATVKSSFSGMGAAVKAGIAGFVGTLTVGYFTSVIKAALDYAGSLREVAQQLGVTTKQLQVYRFAAGQVGVSQDQLEVGLKKLNTTLGQAKLGAEAPKKAFAELSKLIGTDIVAASKQGGDALPLVADALAKVADRSKRAAVEVALMGKSGSALDNLLSGGSSALNELSAAAEKLGIVLSDEQIENADRTADKLEALKTVLSAQIAGVVSDNADSIYKLADSLAQLVSQLPVAIRSLKSFYAQFLSFSANVGERLDQAIEHPLNRFNPLTMPFRGGQMHANRLANIKADRDAAATIDLQNRLSGIKGFQYTIGRPVAAAPSGDIGSFLAPKGGTKKKGPTDQSDEQLAAMQRQQMQADSEILRAKQQLAHSSADRAQIELQLIELDRKMQDAEIDDQIRRAQKDAADGQITKAALQQIEAEAVILKSKNNEAARLKSQAVIDEQIHQQKEDQAHLLDVDFDLQQDALRTQEQLATTAAERRDIELRLLDLSTRQERARLEAVLADEQASDAAKEEARRRLAALNANYAANRAGVMQQTRGPLEEWAAGIPQTAAQINEALQSIQVRGLEGLTSAITDVITGTRKLKDAFGDLAKSVIADLIQMSVRMLIFRALSSIIGGGLGQSRYPVIPGQPDPLAPLPAFASGGFMSVGGVSGTDRNLLSINGIARGRVSADELLAVVPKAGFGGRQEGGVIVNQTFAPNFAGNAATHEDLVRMASLTKVATIEAIHQERRRGS